MSLVARALRAGFVDLRDSLDGVLDTLPDEGEAAFKCGFPLAELGVDRIVAGLEQLSDLVDAEEGIGVEDEDEEEFTGRETGVCERRVSGVCEAVAAIATPDSGTYLKRKAFNAWTLTAKR